MSVILFNEITNTKKYKFKHQTDSNLASNSDIYSESINTSSDKSLNEDNIDINFISDTNSSDKDSDAEHSSKNSDAEHSNKNSDIEHSNKKYNIKTKSQKNTSWLSDRQREYRQLVKTQGSTGNFQTYLNTLRITKPIKVINSIIVTNLQLLYLLQNKSFIEFVYTLNLYYELLSDKYIKELIYQSYNYSVISLKKLFTSEIETCKLTYDFWTTYSKSDYIRVICHFINSDYKLNEVILVIRHILYPHDAITIKNELENIIINWVLEELTMLLAPFAEITELLEEEDIIDFNEELEIITTSNRNKFKLSQPQNTESLVEKVKANSWKCNKAISLLQEEYNLLSNRNETINNLLNEDQNKNHMKLFSIIFGFDEISISNNKVNEYFKIDQLACKYLIIPTTSISSEHLFSSTDVYRKLDSISKS
ncbi:10078_t:CDS:2 [Scutellospora calospora]|uniref:10078_t:CDS:1 n=1 Tax=Scutellospora calospora TaxID=85575 RepID=A0ACA9K956_9GLOM|nr:10078_t:CDS:2 [Scutellospora calospora]